MNLQTQVATTNCIQEVKPDREILSEAETQIFSAESSSSPERSPLPVFVREFALNDYWLALTSPVRTGQPPVLLSIEELLSV